MASQALAHAKAIDVRARRLKRRLHHPATGVSALNYGETSLYADGPVWLQRDCSLSRRFKAGIQPLIHMPGSVDLLGLLEKVIPLWSRV